MKFGYSETDTHVIWNGIDEQMVFPKRAPYWYPPQYVPILSAMRDAVNIFVGTPTLFTGGTLVMEAVHYHNVDMTFKGVPVRLNIGLSDDVFVLE